MSTVSVAQSGIRPGSPAPYPGGGLRDLAARRRMSRSMVGSIVFHAILFLALLLTGNVGNEPGALTEISWLASEPAVPAPPAAPPVPEVGASGPAPERKHFERRQELGEIEPEPQAPVLQDRLDERLASLQRRETEARVAIPVAVAAPTGRMLSAAPVGETKGSPTPRALQRVGTRSGPALELKRVEPSAVMPAAAIAVPKPTPPPTTSPAETVAERELAGATLLGPVANRKLLAHPAPVYPDWAKREGVEVSVRLYFIVRTDGSIQENIVVEKTSGYEDFDANALAALGRWRFESLRNAVGDQWGRITFRFRLEDAGR